MITTSIKIHPLSVNKCWQGKRFKTKEYEKYELDLSRLLKKQEIIFGPVRVRLRFHLKELYRGDLDNLIKPLMDILVKKGYLEDDRKVLKYELEKVKAKTVDEYIEIVIEKIK